MRKLKGHELAVMFWAGRDPAVTLQELKEMDIRSGQLGVPGDFDISQAPAWKLALLAADFHVYTVFAAYEGESYTDIPAVRATVGFVPQNTREARERRTEAVIRFANELGVECIATHIGCIPEDRGSAEYRNIVEMVQRICDYAGQFRQKMALETGQEPAEALKLFLHDVDRPNLGINFDPANMILYGTGDPIVALRILGPHLLSVHCKDGRWPPEDNPNKLGEEQPLGKGDVDFPLFLRTLQEVGYSGPLAIEREGSEPNRRLQDIRNGIDLLRGLQLSGA